METDPPAGSIDLVRRVAAWAGHPLLPDQEDRLAAYAAWLEEEAIPAGGLGPREGPRLWGRHLADSLAFAAGWRDREPPAEILDVGSGVGLPGIPLAILWPETVVTTLDRGGRRIRLLRRATRVAGLVNVEVAQGDVFSVADEWESVVFRGAVKAPEAVGLTARLLDVGGTAVLGLSRRSEVPADARDLTNLAEALGLAAEVVEVPSGVLDATAWLLIMRLGE
ncbi:MAG: class I SAM-dependent methyltransferase [Actinobacteria bacterium]|nr:class I SAM-dependent methyltransferase [Actinomycetota bacterium]